MKILSIPSFSDLRTLVQNKLKMQSVRQSLLLLVCNFTSLLCGMGVNLLITRILGVVEYGNFTFLIAILSFTSVLLNFGFFNAVNRALVLEDDPLCRREYYGGLIVILLVLTFFAMLLLFGYGLFSHELEVRGIRKLFFLGLPAIFVFFTSSAFDGILQADNRVKAISALSVCPRLILITILPFLYFTGLRQSFDSLAAIWSLYILSVGFVHFSVFLTIRPRLKNISKRMTLVRQCWKTYGFNMYCGNLFVSGVNHLTPILLGYLSPDRSDVGLYTLGILFTAPLLIIPNAIAISNFARFSKQARLKMQNILVAFLLSLGGVLALWTIMPFLIRYLYGESFLPVIKLTYVISVGYLCWGMADFFMRFVSSHGQGKAIRNVYFCMGCVSIILNVLLVPCLGATGSALTLLINGMFYLSLMLSYCHRNHFLSGGNTVS